MSLTHSKWSLSAYQPRDVELLVMSQTRANLFSEWPHCRCRRKRLFYKRTYTKVHTQRQISVLSNVGFVLFCFVFWEACNFWEKAVHLNSKDTCSNASSKITSRHILAGISCPQLCSFEVPWDANIPWKDDVTWNQKKKQWKWSKWAVTLHSWGHPLLLGLDSWLINSIIKLAL